MIKYGDEERLRFARTNLLTRTARCLLAHRARGGARTAGTYAPRNPLIMLTLFVKPFCQYCRKVLAYAEKNDLTIEIADIAKDPVKAKRLIELGGKRQVPFLIDHERGLWMYESADILEHLKNNYVR